MRKILNLEDDILKHSDINRALEWNGYPKADLATSAETGIAKIEKALVEGEPYDLLITDMQFPINGINNPEAGFYVIEELKRKEVNIPIIVCSSFRYHIPEIAGCIFYNKSRDLNWDFKEILSALK